MDTVGVTATIIVSVVRQIRSDTLKTAMPSYFEDGVPTAAPLWVVGVLATGLDNNSGSVDDITDPSLPNGTAQGAFTIYDASTGWEVLTGPLKLVKVNSYDVTLAMLASLPDEPMEVLPATRMPKDWFPTQSVPSYVQTLQAP